MEISIPPSAILTLVVFFFFFLQIAMKCQNSYVFQLIEMPSPPMYSNCKCQNI